MKPLFISSLYHPHQVGGAEKIARIVAESMLAQGHQPVVVTTQPDPGHRTAEVGGVKVHYIGLRNLYWPYDGRERSPLARAFWHGLDRCNPFMGGAVARVLDEEKPDVVHSHNITGLSSAVWPAVKARDLPLVHTVHDYSLMCPRASMHRHARNCQLQCTTCKLYTAPGKRMSHHVDRVVGVSRFTLQRHLSAGYFPAARPRVIHNALPGPLHVHPRPADAGRPLQLGYVGRLVPAKGIGQLVQQMGAWDASQCQLLVAGNGPAAFESTLRAQAPPNVRFLGFVDPDQVYPFIDALVVPSLWEEPFATTVLEAFQHGLPVIASCRGGLPEAVEPGRTGWIYDPLEPNGLHRAVGELVRNRAVLQDVAGHVRQRAGYFQLPRMQGEYLQLLADAMDITRVDTAIQRRRKA